MGCVGQILKAVWALRHSWDMLGLLRIEGAHGLCHPTQWREFGNRLSENRPDHAHTMIVRRFTRITQFSTAK